MKKNGLAICTGDGDDDEQEKEKAKIANLPKFRMITAKSMTAKYDDYKHFFDEYGPKLVSYGTWMASVECMTPEK